MREIKFRAWNGYRQEMNTVLNIGYFEGLYMNISVDTEDGQIDYNDSPYNMECDNIELMQYTGLKDKNGKEIYEGDIIHINDSFLKEFNYLIKWNKEYLRYYLYSIDTEKLNKIGGILEAHLGSMINEIEVIGNIHENNDLLKD